MWMIASTVLLNFFFALNFLKPSARARGEEARGQRLAPTQRARNEERDAPMV